MIDTRLPMMIQQPNVLAALDAGTTAASNQANLLRQAEGQNLFRQYGAQAMAGDQNALRAIGAFDPMMGQQMQANQLGMQQTRQSMSINAERMQMLRDETARGLAAAEDQAEAMREAQEADRLGRMAIAAFASQDADTFRAITQELLDRPLDPTEDGLAAVAAIHEGALTFLKNRPQPVQQEFGVVDGMFFDKNNPGAGAQPIPGMPQGGAEESQREMRIQALARDLVAEGMSMDEAMRRARGTIEGRFQVSDGIVFDRARGDVDGFDPVDPNSPPPSRGLYDRAPDATGLAARAAQMSTDTLGQVPLVGGFFQFPDQVQAQQAYATATNNLIRSLSVNPRFPVAEMQRIERELGFSPSVWRSPEGTQARMRELDTYLARRAQIEAEFANTQGNPLSERNAASRAVRDIQAFREEMGVPQETQSTQLPPAVAENPQLRDVAERNGLTVEELWENLSPEARQRFEAR